jgi:hypothetical protein
VLGDGLALGSIQKKVMKRRMRKKMIQMKRKLRNKMKQMKKRARKKKMQMKRRVGRKRCRYSTATEKNEIQDAFSSSSTATAKKGNPRWLLQ